LLQNATDLVICNVTTDAAAGTAAQVVKK